MMRECPLVFSCSVFQDLLIRVEGKVVVSHCARVDSRVPLMRKLVGQTALIDIVPSDEGVNSLYSIPMKTAPVEGRINELRPRLPQVDIKVKDSIWCNPLHRLSGFPNIRPNDGVKIEVSRPDYNIRSRFIRSASAKKSERDSC